ncbi:leucyl aminopeptidase family protein [Rhodoligotrophos defluvii]|uniref:leucyl aminopeptidase family protein n=1 Tax=Rhodoligotrophos defluvii TaxID=2561934 RepID=UPI0010C96476|nr:leucyl aminopeptidase family protein [Rhodoligotrophos defluvii]
MTDYQNLLLEANVAGVGEPIPVKAVAKEGAEAFLAALGEPARSWAKAQDFGGKAGQLVLVPNRVGGMEAVLYGLGSTADGYDPFAPGKLASQLPPGVYRFADDLPEQRLAALAWLLESYRFTGYKSQPEPKAKLVAPEECDRDGLIREARAVALARDLINTPSNDMGPAELAEAARTVAETGGARFSVIDDQQVLKRDFPMVHAVGKASAREPRLIDFTWGEESAPKLTLVGKGVCFDTGGLDVKPASGMLLMKKDMGGAANVLGLASLVMAAKLPVRLRVLIPAVENSISGAAFRPGDVLRSRKGLTVEIGNTDAEGRLILADALALAEEEQPDLIIDMATLTGAARVALGPDLPAFFCSDDALAGDLARHGTEHNDPLWRLPFHQAYSAWLDSKVADMNNVSDGSFAGAITAALFLRKFVGGNRRYIHVDLMAWNQKARPGRPIGGEAQGMRALYALIAQRYRL